MINYACFCFVLFCFEIQTPVVKISFYYYQRGSENLQLITLLKICQIGEIKLNPDILLTIRSKIQQSKPLKIKALFSSQLFASRITTESQKSVFIVQYSHLILMTNILELWGKTMCHLVLCIIIFKKLEKIARSLCVCLFKQGRRPWVWKIQNRIPWEIIWTSSF